MSAWMLLMIIVPYLMYVFIDHKYGLKAGIIAAILIVIGFGFFIFAKTGSLDELFFLDAGFIIGLGALSIKMRDSRWFKLQPTIVDCIFAAYIFYLQIFSVPLMVRYLPTMEAFIDDPGLLALLQTDGMKMMLGNLSRDAGFALIIHAAINAFAALKLSNVMWLLARVSIFPIFILLGAMARLLYGHLIGA